MVFRATRVRPWFCGIRIQLAKTRNERTFKPRRVTDVRLPAICRLPGVSQAPPPNVSGVASFPLSYHSASLPDRGANLLAMKRETGVFLPIGVGENCLKKWTEKNEWKKNNKLEKKRARNEGETLFSYHPHVPTLFKSFEGPSTTDVFRTEKIVFRSRRTNTHLFFPSYFVYHSHWSLYIYICFYVHSILYLIYGAFHAKSTRMKPSLFFHFILLPHWGS